MAKELPYFKFEPSEWLEGNIQICSDTSIACFINLCSGYWTKLGCISYAFALHKYCRKDKSVIDELIQNEVIHVLDDKIVINFLDEQLNEFKEKSKKRREAANIRWSNANALQVNYKSNAIREEKRREDKSILKIKKDIIERKTSFASSLSEVCLKKNVSDLHKKEFFNYWSEHGEKDKKMRFEKEKSFDIALRVERWLKNLKKWESEKPSKKMNLTEKMRRDYGIN